MLNERMHIDLVTRWRTMSRVLDILIPESTSLVLKEAFEAALDAVRRGELADAIVLLEEGVQANPFWLRGYLLLATSYEYAQKAESAISTMEQGLAVCASGLRLFSSQRWGEMLERINGPVVHSRIRNHAERFGRYERMFRHQLVMLQLQEASRMKDSPSPSAEVCVKTMKYCDRCARRSVTLFSDDLTLRELCRDCCDQLKRQREMATHPAKPKM